MSRFASSIAIAAIACLSWQCGNAAGPPADDPTAVDVVRSCAIPPVPDVTSVRLSLDVPVYAPQGQTQLLNIVRPLGGGPHPLVILIHGGAWRDGHQHLYVQELGQLASLGYVATSISYRLTPTYRFPAAIEDVQCAIRFLRAKSDSLGIDPTRVALVGASAGGHLAALAAAARDPVQFN